MTDSMSDPVSNPVPTVNPTPLQAYPIHVTDPEWHGSVPLAQIRVNGSWNAVPCDLQCKAGDRLMIVPAGVRLILVMPPETASGDDIYFSIPDGEFIATGRIYSK